MRTLVLRAALGVCLLVGGLFPNSVSAAPRSGTGPVYPQMICVVPMVGLGTLNDPRRPLLAPVSGQAAATASHSKGFVDAAVITSYRSVLSDDGLFAIVLFEARDRAAFKPILANQNLLKSFDLSKTSAEMMLAPLRAYKKNFELRMLAGGSL